jgi:hypothetical protein
MAWKNYWSLLKDYDLTIAGIIPPVLLQSL